jgi:asparagine synthase (glutamine-hydrolysing)
MSGIFGFYEINNNECNLDDKNILSPMLSWNRLYGSDCHDNILNKSGTYFPNEKIFEYQHNNINFKIGCCYFSFSKEFSQKSPILQTNEYICAIDAHIYNRKDIMANCSITDNLSDEELLLKYITKNGLCSLANINGDFAGIIFNTETMKLTLFRDHMGVRPLFFYQSDSIVAFSSDIRGLLALPKVNTKVDEKWLYQTVSGYDADTLNNTPYTNVKCVTPASFIDFSLDKKCLRSKEKKYWKLRSHKIKYCSKKQYEQKLRNLIEDAVKIRLESIPETASAEISGGLDSSIIDILINRFGKKCIYCSWSSAPSQLNFVENDERLIISDICAQEKIKCNYILLNSQLEEKLHSSMQSAGINLPDKELTDDFKYLLPPGTNTYQILATALYAYENGSRFVFTGHGGDEGVSHRCNAYELFYNHEYYHYLKQIHSIAGPKKHLRRTVQIALDNISKFNKRGCYVSTFSAPELLNEAFQKKYIKEKERKLTFSYDPIAYIENGGSRNRLDNLALFGALAGVRYMVPYLDYRVIDYAVSIPRYLFINGKIKRFIFRQAFKDIMPKSLYELDSKETPSLKQLKPSPDRYDKLEKRMNEVVEHLDKDYYEKYLDFNKINALKEYNKPTDENYSVLSRKIITLAQCACAHNLIAKSKEYVSG